MENIISADELSEWTNKQLESSDRFWRLIYDSMADPVFILSNQGVILFCNKASEDFLGISMSEIIGTHCYENVHKINHFIEGCPFVKSMKSKKRETYQFLINNKWYLITIDPLINSSGIVIGAIHFITDINKIVSLNATRTNLAGIIENTTDAIAEVSLNSTFEYWNQGAENLLGYSEEEIIGKDVHIVIADECKPQYEEVMKKIAGGETVGRFESVLLKKTGERIEVSISIQVMYDEKKVITGVSFMAHDLTPGRKAERELLYFITESALRIKRPVEILRNNLEEMKNLLASGNISEDDVEKLLDVKISNANQILENLKEINAAIVESEKEIPEEYARFLKR